MIPRGLAGDLVLFLGYFIFTYPIAMSVIWVTGGLMFWFRREHGDSATAARLAIRYWPAVTVLVPCRNESAVIDKTCRKLRFLDYPDYRVVFIDDGSSDGTGDRIRQWVNITPHFHLVRLQLNRGKAGALNYALRVAVKTPVTVVIDADTLLAGDALRSLVQPFLLQPRLGAVTGNPLVSNRIGLLEKVQAAEFASIIGLVKRTQRVLGRLLTVSGCVSAYWTDALREVGGFSQDTATEDIDVTWRLHRRSYDVWFVPQAVAMIHAPRTLGEYWRQRCRWALGGWHLLRTHRGVFTRWRWRRLWPLYLDFVLGGAWSFCFVAGSLIWLGTRLLTGGAAGFSPVPAWNGAVLSLACLVQFAVALLVNHRYDPGLWRTFFWVPWYPLVFFVVGALAVVWTAPRGIFGSLHQAGRWRSPIR